MLENENGNGKRTATVYDTYLRDKKRARFNVKKRGIPFCATYSPDGRTLFVATDRGIFPADPRTLETGECLERTGSIPDMLLVSPNGYFLLAIAGDRCAVYNLEEGKVRKTLLTGQRITDAMFSPDSREMVLLSDDGMASVYNMNTLTVRKMIDGLGQARAGALNFDGKYLAVADRPDNIVLVNTLRDTDRTNIHVPDGDIRDLGFIYDAGRNTLMVYPVPGAVKARRMPLLKPYYNKLIDEEVNARMEEWLKMQPGETMEQYASRVTDETRAEQRRMFEYEITTRLAGNLIAGQPVGIGEYNRANGMLALKPGDMPQIFINVPEEEATAFSDPALVSLSEVLYGVMDDDTFEIVYARVTNGVNGKSYIFDNRNRKPLDYMKGGRRNLAPGAPAAEDGGGAAARTQRARRQRGQEHERNLRPYQHLGGLARGGRLRRQRAPHPQLRGELHLRRRPGLLGAGRLPLRQVPRGAVGRRLQSMHYDGITEAGLYPEVLAAHRAISSALAMPELTDTDARLLRSMLLDLDPLLFKGAIYYSSTGDDAAMKLCAITAVDTRLRPDMASLPFTPQPQLWPELLYCAALGLPAVVSAGMPESVAYDDRQPTRGNAAKTPGFNEFASPLVQRRFADWAKRGEFEELRDYDRRMNEQGYDEYRRLCDEAAEEYIGIYGGRLRLSDLTLHPYDVDDETHLITSGMGPRRGLRPQEKEGGRSLQGLLADHEIPQPALHCQGRPCAHSLRDARNLLRQVVPLLHGEPRHLPLPRRGSRFPVHNRPQQGARRQYRAGCSLRAAEHRRSACQELRGREYPRNQTCQRTHHSGGVGQREL